MKLELSADHILQVVRDGVQEAILSPCGTSCDDPRRQQEWRMAVLEAIRQGMADGIVQPGEQL
jgi:hypothetical protein